MPRIRPLEAVTAPGKSKQLLAAVTAKLGRTPNILATLAHSPAALDAYLAFGQALAGGALGVQLRESVALTVAGENRCDYCASAHTAMGAAAGLGSDELAHNLEGRSADAEVGAALAFAKALVAKRGLIGDDDLARVRAAGFDDGAIAEIVGHVALNTFTNYFNNVAQTEIDFPSVDARRRVAA